MMHAAFQVLHILRALCKVNSEGCPNCVAGLKSIYWWDGKVRKDSELLLIMKTQAALLQQLVDTVKSHHPYDEPEVISLPISGGSRSYLQWIHDSTGASKDLC